MTRARAAALFLVLGILGMLGAYLILDLDGRDFKLPLGIVALSAAWLWIGFGLRRRSRTARFLAMGFSAVLLVGGVLVPLYVLVLFMFAPDPVASFLESPESIARMKRIAQFIGVSFFVGGIAGFHVLRYLRSIDGRLEYTGVDPDIEQAVLQHESIGYVIGPAVVAIVAMTVAPALTVRLATSSLPDFVKSKKALEREAIEMKYKNAPVTSEAFFSADSRHLVIPPSESVEDFLVLELDSGKLRRVAAGRHEFDPSIDVAPDASAIVSGSQWISLKDGGTRRLAALPEGDHLGFVSPQQFLAYDTHAQQIRLVDLTNDRALYEHPVAREERGENHPVAGYARNSLWDRDVSNDRVSPRNVSLDRRAWSSDRKKYFWMTKDRVLHVLDVASGTILDRTCKHCRYAASPMVAPAGDTLFFVTRALYGELGRDAGRGSIFRIGFDEWRDVELRGKPMYFAESGAFMLLRQVGSDRITFRDLASATPREWVLPLPETSKYAELRGGRVLEVRVAGRQGANAHYALFSPPAANQELKFVPLRPRVPLVELKEISADGRYLLLVAGATIEIVDVDALLKGSGASRTMHVLEDEALRAVESDAVTPPVYPARWVEREVEMPPSQQIVEVPLQVEPVPVARQSPAWQPPAGSRPTGDAVLKCVSPSGGVMFTQGACPAGTRQQDQARKDSF